MLPHRTFIGNCQLEHAMPSIHRRVIADARWAGETAPFGAQFDDANASRYCLATGLDRRQHAEKPERCTFTVAQCNRSVPA
jgi:hypothetical protein